MRMKNSTSLRGNSRGAALVSVIVAMVVVAAIGMLILGLAYTNLNMKVIEKKAKNNFYTAEAVLDDIIAELEKEMSRQYVEAYSTVMADYGYYEGRETSAGEDLQEAMLRAFRQEFIVDMATYLAKDATDLTHYDIAKLGRIETEDPEDNTKVIVTSAFDGKYPNRDQLVISSTGNELQTFETTDDAGNVTGVGLLIKNIQVYYAEDGYANTINTDIRIMAPTVLFARISSTTDVSKYAYIAQGGIDVLGTGSMLSVNGNAFSGLITAVSTGATLDATGSSLLVSKGETVLTAGSVLKTGAATAFWTEGLTGKASPGAATAGNRFELAGRTYVRDDTTLNGADNTLILGGEYYGFSSSNTSAAESSAIIVNGRNTVLDLSGLKTLVLAGSAFVSTTNISNSFTASTASLNKDVLTGESIAVKGNQIAYLVPKDVFLAAGIPANPMTAAQYNALKDKVNADGVKWDVTALTTTIPSLENSIRAYDSGATIVPEFVTGAHSADQQVYLYICFSSTAKAKEYFMALYQNDPDMQERLSKYLDFYVYAYDFMSNIGGTGYQLLSNGNYLTRGDAFTDTDGSVKYRAAFAASNTTNVTAVQALANYKSSFENLCTSLTTTTTSSAAVAASVYETLIRKDAVDGVNATITKADDAGDVYAVVADGDYTFPVGLSGKGGIIIASGNVTMNAGTWNGIIICDGKLTITGTATLTANPVNVEAAKALATELGVTGLDYIGNFFVGGENYAPATAGSGVAADTSSSAREDIRSCLTLENYYSE